MKKHTELYLKVFGYDTSSYIPCECCNSKAVDIHHIEARGMGGTKKPEDINNLMALCRNCHEKYGDKKQFKPYLYERHYKKLSRLI